MTLVLLLFLLAFFGFLFLTYQRLNTQVETIRNNHKQLDLQLDRRFKSVQSLSHMIKKDMDLDHTMLKEIAVLHNKAEAAEKHGDEKTRMNAENQISGLVSSLNILFEQYTDLKSNPDAIHLQKEMISLENNLAYAKEAYNDSIEIYNANKSSFPASILVSLFKTKLDFTFTPWQLNMTKKIHHEGPSYTVQL
jgi:LemA protein